MISKYNRKITEIGGGDGWAVTPGGNVVWGPAVGQLFVPGILYLFFCNFKQKVEINVNLKLTS